MRKRPYSKLVQEGEFLAEVNLERIETDERWSPYLSLDDAYKLDDTREALRQGDLQRASQFGRVYRMTPVAV
jgi:hypothetical protein